MLYPRLPLSTALLNRRLLSALFCAAGLLSVPAQGQVAGAKNIVINEMAPTASGDHEIELYNYGPSNQVMTGWTLTYDTDTGVSTSHVISTFTFPAFTLNRHAFVEIHWAAGTNSTTDLYRGSATTVYTEGQIILKDNLGNGIDYLKFGSPFYNAQPADLSWWSNASYTTSACPLYRNKDLNTRVGTDWSNTATCAAGTATAPTYGLLNPNQVGTRRHGKVIINEFYIGTATTIPWIEIYNPTTSTVYMTGGKLEAFDDTTGTPCFTYNFTSPNTYFLSPGAVVAIDLPSATTCVWHSSISGGLDGQIRLVDAVGEGWDYVAFNNSTNNSKPSGVAWTGGDFSLSALTFTYTATRKGDLDSDSALEWQFSTSNNTTTKGTRNTPQSGAFFYDELGSEAGSISAGTTGVARGNVINVTAPFMLKEFKARIQTLASSDIHLVVRKLTSTGPEVWTSIYDLPLLSQTVQDGVFSTGPINLAIDSPGTYAFMVYGSAGFTYYRAPIAEQFNYGSFVNIRGDIYPPAATTALPTTITGFAMSQYFLTSPGPDITTLTLPNGEVAVPYSQTITRSGGTAPIVWTLASGTLPPGLALTASSGLISGTPTTSGTYAFSITATDSNGTGVSDTQSYTVIIYNALTISNLLLLDAEVGFAYSRTLLASGGSGGRVWSKTSGPAWMGVSAGGVLSGTPTATGTALLTASVTDSLNGIDSHTYNTINVQPVVQVATASLPNGQPGVVYAQTLMTTGGVPAFLWSLTAGDLPHGLALNINNGGISGTPLYPGSFNFTVSVSDYYGATATRALTITVIRPLSIISASLPNAVTGINYANAGGWLQAEGGTGPYTYTLAGGSLPLPPVITLPSDGKLTGTPTTLGVYPSTYQVTDSLGATATRTLSITVIRKGDPPIQWRSRGLHGGKISKVTASPNYATDLAVFSLGGRGQYFVSADGAENWTQVTPDPQVSDVTFDDFRLAPTYVHTGAVAAARQTILIHAPQKGILRSTDRGATWARLMGGFACAADYLQTCPQMSAAFSPSYVSDSTVWLVANSSPEQLYKSVAGGAWTSVGTLPVVASPKYLTLSPNFVSDRTMYFADGAKLYRTRDGGVGWTLVFTTSSPVGITDIKISPDFALDRTLMVETYGKGVYRSRDRGDSFTSVVPPLGLYDHVTGPSPVKPATGPVRWYLTNGYSPLFSGYYKLVWTDDGGDTFTSALAENIPGIQDQDLEASPDLGGRSDLFVFGGWYISGILKSDDSGLFFDHRDKGVTAQNIHDLAGTGATVVGLGDLMEWFKSGDTGAGWVGLDHGTTIVDIGTVAVSPNYSADGVFFFGDLPYSSNLERTDDGGQSFTVVMDDTTYGIVNAISLASNFNGATGTAFVVTRNGLWKSTNGGLTFTAVTVPASCFDPATSVTKQLKVSPNYPADGTLFLFAKAGAICKGTGGGTTWTVVASGMPSPNFNTFDISPTYNELGASGTGKTIFYISLNQLYKSTDGGAIWNQITGTDFCGKPMLSPKYNLDGTVFIYNDIAGPYSTCVTHLQRSIDFGVTYTPVGTASELYGRAVSALYLPPTYDGRAPATSTVVAGTNGNGIFRSTDDGLNYISVSEYKVISKQVNAIAQAPLPPGLTWQQWLTERAQTPRALASVQSGDQLVATYDSGIFQSTDGGMTYAQLSKGLPANANTQSVMIPANAVAAPLTGVAGNSGMYRYNGSSWIKQLTSPVSSAGNYSSFLEDGTYLYATNSNGVSLRSADGGATWQAQDAAQTQLVSMDYNASSAPTTFGEPAAGRVGPRAANYFSATSASLWSAGQTGGPLYSLDNGATWIAAPGTGDYTIPGAQTYKVIQALGINPASGGRDVITGTTTGLYKSTDGGASWRSMTGTGSGLEATSKNFAAILKSPTAYSTTDILVGAVGATTGGVYLSGDGGEHWTQINQGFDPNNLSVSSLVKTSCSGCPVQYYSGTYGNGVYTRTIAVNSPPTFPSPSAACFGSTVCACVSTAGSGPVSGGQDFKICGANFQAGAVVEFDGVPVLNPCVASGCTNGLCTTLTCSGATPPHYAGTASVRIRNPDTRMGVVPNAYNYTSASSRTLNALRVAKAGSDANLTWSCSGCTSAVPARIYRSQNAPFTAFIETYNGGISGAYTNSGAVISGQNYFWSVE